MSVDATRWAWTRTGLRPIQKLVLLALADRAGADDLSYPAYETLIADTGADRKTIWQALKALKQRGLIGDSGSRRGATGQIVAWRLHGVEHRQTPAKHAKNGTLNPAASVPKTEPLKGSGNGRVSTPKPHENGTVSSAKDSESGTVRAERVPKTESLDRPRVPETESFCDETVPKTEPGTYRDKKIKQQTPPLPPKPSKAQRKAGTQEPAAPLPEGLPAEIWQAFREHRKAIKAPLTPAAEKLALKKIAELRAAGHDPAGVVEQSILNGWKGLFELRVSHPAGSPGGSYAPHWRHPQSVGERQRAADIRRFGADIDEADGYGGIPYGVRAS